MRGHRAIRRLPAWLVSMLTPLLVVSAPTFALPADFADVDVPGFTETGPGRPLADIPAASVPVVNPVVPRSPSSVPREAMKGNPLWTVPLAILSETSERPIFSASRRPPPPVVSASVANALPPPPPTPPQAELHLVLVGTVIGGDQSIGIFVDENSKATLRLKLDGDYQGWQLRSVHRREVIMARGELTETLELTKSANGAPAIGAAVAESKATRGSSHTAQYD